MECLSAQTAAAWFMWAYATMETALLIAIACTILIILFK